MAQDLRACCCPCYPVWFRYSPDESTSFNWPTEDPNGTILRSPLFEWNTTDTTQHGPVPKFINVKILPPESASSGGIDGPKSPLDGRSFDVMLDPGMSTINDANPRATLCTNFLWYCGRHQLNLNVPKLDGSGTVKITELRILVLFSVQDWDYTDQCRFPRFVVETFIFADTDESGEGGAIYAGHRSTGGPGTITTVADGWLTTINQTLGFVQNPPSGTGAISFPPTYRPDLPVLVSPLVDDTSDPTDYQYPLRNRRVLLQCSKRARMREENRCIGDETPIDPASSSGYGTSSYQFSTSGGDPSGGVSGGSSGGASGGSGGISGGAFYLEALVCGTDEPSGLYYDFTGVDDGQVWYQQDGRCVYADLSQEATETSSPAVDLSTPLGDCFVYCDVTGVSFDNQPTTAGVWAYIVDRVACSTTCVDYECNEIVEFGSAGAPPEYIEITEGECAGVRFRLLGDQ